MSSSTPQTTLWPLKPHTKAKHEILRRYLGAWFSILALKTSQLVYIDGFAGPGVYADGEDGSPIYALQIAAGIAKKHPHKTFRLIFVEKDKKRAEFLKNEADKRALTPNVAFEVVNDEFRMAFPTIMRNLKGRTKDTAVFAFVDPFGIKGVPMSYIAQLLKRPKAEVFINIMTDSINRFVEHPDDAIRGHIADTFGIDNVYEVIRNAPDRFLALKDLYQSQLKKYAQFVRYFEMKNEKNRPIYYLFFASNSRKGHTKMKDAFWKVDETSGYTFSDATNPDQPVLIEIDPSESLARLLSKKFSGQRVLTKKVVDFVEDQTFYRETHAKKALVLLEIQGGIAVEPLKSDNSKRKRGSFPPGVTVIFK